MEKKRLMTGAAVGAESKDTDDFTAVCDYSHEWRAVDQAVHTSINPSLNHCRVEK